MKLSDYLQSKEYPGRGIMVGRTATHTVMAYFIMGRSVNSQNRVFEQTEDGIRTKAFDESKMEDPSLIIYAPVRKVGDVTVVTNGDQTDTIRDYLVKGDSFENALRTREFEPDGPNWTPRISAAVNADGSFKMSILKSDKGNEAQCLRYFYEYAQPIEGEGRIIHTYNDNGNPIPSFDGEPKTVCGIEGDIDTVTDMIWESLNEQNKVSLFVRLVDRQTGEAVTKIVSKNK